MQRINKVVVAGAGLMGASIAQSFPHYGYETVVYSNQEQDFERARQVIANCQNTLVENNVLSAQESRRIQDSISYRADPNCFHGADLVIEAIPEIYDIKADFFQMISGLLSPESIVATNTSAISIQELAKNMTNPERFCGTHWLNPPHIIPLVEIIPSTITSPGVVDILVKLLTGMGKEPVVLKKDIRGFLSNRLQFALLREASYLVESGVATPEDIDRTLKFGNGIRYSCSGPFKIVDFGGVAVFNSVANYLYPELSNQTEGCSLLEQMVQKGNNGISTGRGFYDYTPQSAVQEEQERDQKMLLLLNQ
jgi:3-hydroxybutyryl-CoA dehydrogenase